MKPLISIVIVHYHVKEELFACIASILASKTKTSYEIIVVDNDEKKTLREELKKKFPHVRYIPNKNGGFGQGNNVGAKQAKGKYLFFLNPDTEVFPHAIERLITFFNKNKNVGIVAPLLFGKDTKPYQQGTLDLTPKRAIFSLSFLHKLFPKNSIAQNYYLKDWDKQSVKEVDVVPGTALLVKKDVFKKAGRFDEKFFLYFEEFDLCRRIKSLGLQNYIDTNARVFHHWGASSKSRTDINKIFLASRFYYFKKNFGVIPALFTETFLRISNYMLALSFIVAIGLFLRIDNIDKTMPFIGDQGWFYLSARDMVLNGDIPLVGIASSHPWLHQGALWTYLLGVTFFIFGFNPLNGAYLTAVIDILAIIFIYKLGKELFSKHLGIIAASFYATSPLIVYTARMPYHTSPIPLFTILFILFLYKWIKGNKYYFPLLIGILTILYNLELATVVFTGILLLCLFYGLLNRLSWSTQIFQIRILLFVVLAFCLGMLPMLIYDSTHGFSQTVGFLLWMGYKIFVVFGFPPLNPTTSVSWSTMFVFAAEKYMQLVFPANIFVATIIIFGSIGFFVEELRQIIIKRKAQVNIIIVSLVTLVPVVGLFVVKTPSGAYLPMLFPGFILVAALFFEALKNNRKMKLFGIASIVILILGNIGFFITQSYTFYPDKDSFAQRMNAAKQIVTEADGKEYNIKGEGLGSQFESFTMNYEYLTWWLGQQPSPSTQRLQFVISETEKGIFIKKVYD